MRNAISHLINEDSPEVRLSSFSENHAIKFYEKKGFKVKNITMSFLFYECMITYKIIHCTLLEKKTHIFYEDHVTYSYTISSMISWRSLSASFCLC
jgi:hypothetical protein